MSIAKRFSAMQARIDDLCWQRVIALAVGVFAGLYLDTAAEVLGLLLQ